MAKSISIVPVLSMMFLPSAAILVSASATLYMGAPLDPLVLITAWAIVFGIYGLNRFTDVEDMVNNPEKRIFFKSHPGILFASIATMAISTLLLLLTHRFTIVHFFMLFTGTAYSIRLIPVFQKKGEIKFKRLKEIPFLKSTTVAVIWGVSFFLINLALYPHLQSNNLEIALLMISFTLVTFVNTNFLDIPDLVGDRATGIPTIPAQFGVKNTMIYIILLPSLLWLGIILCLFYAGIIGDKITLFLLVNALFPVFYIGCYFSKFLSQKKIGIAADSCAFVFSIGLLCLYCIREKTLFFN
jgi:4-hydroxybenzoate polyprenyltransferase